MTWNVLEYLALFLIVTIHEFGHSLACRQVGGKSEPDRAVASGRCGLCRPSAAAGRDPLEHRGWAAGQRGAHSDPVCDLDGGPVFGMARSAPDLYHLLEAVLYDIDLGLLIFNILPIYPLDGGQILRSLLWFVIGRARSLMVATVLGLVGVAGFIALALWQQSVWLGAIALFMLMNCWSGLQHARALLRLAKLPRRDGFLCPTCQTRPRRRYWKCGKCGQAFDTFQNHAVCPHCSTQFPQTHCLDCGRNNSMNDWMLASAVPGKL